MGFIYLIQPAVLIDTNRYKIGVSTLNNLSRLKTYGNNTKYLSILECKNPFEIERDLVKKFNLLFKNIAGREYFEVQIEESELIKIFIDFVLNYQSNKFTLPSPKNITTEKKWMEKFKFKPS